MEIIAITIEIIAKMLATIDCEYFGIITAIRLFTLLQFIRQRNPLKISIELCLFAKPGACIMRFLYIQIFYNKNFKKELKGDVNLSRFRLVAHNLVSIAIRKVVVNVFFIRPVHVEIVIP